jgi:hypothetical protein
MSALIQIGRWLPIRATAVLLVALTSGPGAAQSASYTELNVKGRVHLAVPSEWTINDAEHRKRVTELSAKLTGVQAPHTASLSVQSYPTPSRMFVRVSFLKLDPPITQSEVRKELQTNRPQVLRDLTDTWREESPTMWAALAKSGVKEVGRPSFAVELLGGQTALVIRYGRTSTVNPAEAMKVTQYHVPLGTEKALITLSYMDGDRVAMAAHDRVKSSITIR